MNIYLRKIWRLCALIFPLLYIPSSRKDIIFILGVFFLLVLSLDILRFFCRPLASFLSKIFSKILKEEERQRISSTTIFILVILLCFIFFPKKIAILVIIFSIVGDTFSTLIGKKFAHLKFKNKSLEGSMGFFLSSILAGFIFKNFLHIDFTTIFLGAGIATLIEFLTFPPLDDNITVPLLTGSILWSIR